MLVHLGLLLLEVGALQALQGRQLPQQVLQLPQLQGVLQQLPGALALFESLVLQGPVVPRPHRQLQIPAR